MDGVFANWEREREKRIVTYCLNFIDVFCLFIFLNFEFGIFAKSAFIDKKISKYLL